jgi:hypothetical protein
VVRSIARVLFMIGFVGAAFVALTIFDQAARAEGVADPPVSVDKPAVVEKTLQAGAERAASQKVERRKAEAPKPPHLKAAVREVTKRVNAAPAVETRAVPAVKANVRRASTLRAEARKAPGLVRKASVLPVNAAGASARQVTAALVTQPLKDLKLPAERDVVAGRVIAAVPDIPVRPKPSANAALPAATARPARPTAVPVPLPQAAQVSPRASLSSADHPSAPTAGEQVTFLSSARPMPPAGSGSPAARARCDLTEQPLTRHDDSRLSPAPATVPSPASPPGPGNQSAGSSHLRESGGGTAPAVGTVPSSWRPAIAAVAVSPPVNTGASGRTVRYCGPPS